MKNFKVLFVAALLGFVLVLGQPHAVLAASNNAATGVSLSAYDDTTDEFSVTIDSVGPDSVTVSELQDDGTYHIPNSGNSPVLLARVKMSFSGYTYLTNGTHDLAYGGQMFVINNGQVNVAGGSWAGATGVDVPINSATNVISFLYVGYENTTDGDSGYVFASDTVTIRVGESLEDISNTEFEKVNNIPITMSATDSVDTSETFDASEFIASNWYSIYSKNELIEPDLSGLSMTYTDAAGNDYVSSGESSSQIVQAANGNPGSFEVKGTYDTTGFIGPQAKGMNYSKVLDNYFDADGKDLVDVYDGDATHPVMGGMAFWMDANGVQELKTGIKGTMFSSTSQANAQSQVAVVAISPSGYWDRDQDAFGAGIDWDLILSSATLFGTVDFGIAAMGSTYGVIGVSNPIETTETTTVEGTPGFTGLMAFMGVGLIAYLAPRMRKEE